MTRATGHTLSIKVSPDDAGVLDQLVVKMQGLTSRHALARLAFSRGLATLSQLVPDLMAEPGSAVAPVVVIDPNYIPRPTGEPIIDTHSPYLDVFEPAADTEPPEEAEPQDDLYEEPTPEPSSAPPQHDPAEAVPDDLQAMLDSL